MGTKLKALSGAEILKILEGFGFVVISQNGSHVKLRRISIGGSETLIVPAHNQIPKGTLRAIFGQAAKFVPQNDLYPHFFTSER